MSKAVLGYMEPTVDVRTAVQLYDTAVADCDVQTQNTAWPVIDYSNTMSWKWTGTNSGNNAIGIYFKEPNYFLNHLLYFNTAVPDTATGLHRAGIIVGKNNDGLGPIPPSLNDCPMWVLLEGEDSEFLYEEGATRIGERLFGSSTGYPGYYLYENQTPWSEYPDPFCTYYCANPGPYLCRVPQMDACNAFYLHRYALLQQSMDPNQAYTSDLLVKEMAIFGECSLPYDPEQSSYTVTPILPDGGYSTYQALNGRKQTVVYAAMQYRVSMTYTWSNQAATELLEHAIAVTVQNGTPMLFLEPSRKKLYLLSLDTIPVITMPKRNTWSVTIEGTTQP